MTVQRTTVPSWLKYWVMPSFLPSSVFITT
jgi:hypothetical protein